LVSVLDEYTANWPCQAWFAGEKGLGSPVKLEQPMDVERFERVVKGDCMNLSLE
jgi:hypothetical protein